MFQPEKPGEDLVQFLEEHEVDVAFVMAYGHFLGRAILEASRLGMVNFHGSILPKYRGLLQLRLQLPLVKRKQVFH